jgi:Uncharacterized protein conserved in bacteria C-term(DUF2220)
MAVQHACAGTRTRAGVVSRLRYRRRGCRGSHRLAPSLSGCCLDQTEASRLLGDMDTWGLTFLAKARVQQPQLAALMMTQELFETHRSMAVPERYPAPELAPEGWRRGGRESGGLVSASGPWSERPFSCPSGRFSSSSGTGAQNCIRSKWVPGVPSSSIEQFPATLLTWYSRAGSKAKK